MYNYSDLLVYSAAASLNAAQNGSEAADNDSGGDSFSDVLEQIQNDDTSALVQETDSNEQDDTDIKTLLMYLLASSIGGECGSMVSAALLSSFAKSGTDTSFMTDLYPNLYTGTDSYSNGVTQTGTLPASGYGSSVLELASSRIGHPYSQAKAGQANYTDCSYLAQWSYRKTGVNLPRTAAEQAKYCADNGYTVSKEELQPGDLIFFSHHGNGRYKDITHVGIYAGDGMMVDASSSNGKVVYRKLLGGQVMYGRPGAGQNA